MAENRRRSNGIQDADEDGYSLIVIVAMGVWGYFGIVEKLNQHSTRLELMEKDLTENTDFRIKWPRGQLGSLPADSEQFMMIEDLYKTTDKLKRT